MMNHRVPSDRQHTKTLGQVFLHDNNIVKKIIQFSEPSAAKQVVEIGCGKGILTKALDGCNSPVTVIEIDERWLNHTKSLGLKNVSFVLGDALTFDYAKVPKKTAIIANIPYNITTPLIERFSQFKSICSIVIMVQKDMADRLLADVGTKQYGAISIFVNYHFDLVKGFDVSRTCFFPVPNVDSTVLKFIPKESVLNKDDEALFFAMVKSFFWGRRKKIMTCLRQSPYINWVGGDAKSLPQQLSMIKPMLSCRGESLSLTQLLGLFEQLRAFMVLG